MRRRSVPHTARLGRASLPLSLAAGLVLLAPGTVRAAQTPDAYTSEPVVMSGDRVGNVVLPARSHLFVGGLSDTGQLVFSTGALDQSQPELMLQYARGQFTTIVAPPAALTAPWAGDVAWPHNITIARPLSMNGQGHVVFTAAGTYGNSPWGTFEWDPSTGHTATLASKGMVATSRFTYLQPGGFTPSINGSNEVALIGRVKDKDGTSGYALFRIGRDGVTEQAAIPHQTLDPWEPEGNGKIVLDQYAMPSINDAGAIAFLARPDGSSHQNAYLWDHGSVTPVLTVGSPGPAGSKITAIRGVFLNSKNQNILVVASTDRTGNNRFGLYWARNRQAYPLAEPGGGLPGNGQLQTIQYLTQNGESITQPSVAVSPANSLGQHVFLATLNDGSQAMYRLEARGTLTLIMNGGAPAKPVHTAAVTRRLIFVPGSRPYINRRGQILFSAQYEGGLEMVILLTPKST